MASDPGRRTLHVPAGTIAYRDLGAGPALVFVHGVGVNGDLWRHVVPLLADRYRCIVPDWPWGSHRLPLAADVDLSLPGMARIVADFLAGLGLPDATVVGNDTGGAVCQALATGHRDRIGRLVLTSCDAFDRFPPRPQRYLEVVARSRLLTWLLAVLVQTKVVQRTPLAYGWVTSQPMPPEVMRSFTRPILDSADVRRDFRRLLRAVDARYTFEAAEGLRTFDKPALVIWAEKDKLFPVHHGRRLAELLPRGQFVLVPNSRTFLPEEQPERLAEHIRGFLDTRGPSGLQRGTNSTNP
jgi:pimeloyl-ACP methyl ester carboxylesterase